MSAGDRRTILVICASMVIIGMSYGVSAHEGGFPVWLTVLISATVLGGSSEFLFIGIVAAGGAPLLAALAGILVNTRSLGYGLAVGRYLPRGRRMFPAAHLLNDETVALSAAQTTPAKARAAYVMCGIGVLLSWPLGALLGGGLGRLVADPQSLGLDAAFPALLLALAIPSLRDPQTRWAGILGAGAAVATTSVLPAGVPIVVSLIGVAVVELWRRVRGTDTAAAQEVPELQEAAR
ncbi:MAG: AzlC family ABC transporter permease [Gordonia amarae]